MRILHVVPTYLPAVRYGGPIFAVHSLCRALVSRGHQVEVVTTNLDGSGISDVPVGMRVNLDAVQVRYFSSWFLQRISWAPSLANALKHEMGGYDVIHLHSVFLWPTWAAARMARKAHVPYLISPRGMLVKELVGQRSRFVKFAWNQLIEKTNLQRAAAIHATSTLEAEELFRFGWKLPPIVVVPNGVDAPDSDEGADPSEEVKAIVAGQPFVLFFGRLSWKKGLDRLLTAFALTSSGALAIVGPDDEGMVPHLKRIAIKLKIIDRVRFLPRTVLGRDKEYLFAEARLFVLPSYSENFGNAVLEAMRRGVPVIVTPEVGAAEIVRSCQGGIVVAGEPQQFGEAITQLMDNPPLARAMGEAGQHFVSEQYSWHEIAIKMEKLYESLGSTPGIPNSSIEASQVFSCSNSHPDNR